MTFREFAPYAYLFSGVGFASAIAFILLASRLNEQAGLLLASWLTGQDMENFEEQDQQASWPSAGKLAADVIQENDLDPVILGRPETYGTSNVKHRRPTKIHERLHDGR